jgi:hypothetical protein
MIPRFCRSRRTLAGHAKDGNFYILILWEWASMVLGLVKQKVVDLSFEDPREQISSGDLSYLMWSLKRQSILLRHVDIPPCQCGGPPGASFSHATISEFVSRWFPPVSALYHHHVD